MGESAPHVEQSKRSSLEASGAIALVATAGEAPRVHHDL